MDEIEKEIVDKFLNHIRDIQVKGTETQELFDAIHAYKSFLECVEFKRLCEQTK